MTWDSYRKLSDDTEVNQDAKSFPWEEEHIPLLHSGFLECTKGRKPKCRLVITLLFTRGQYVMKLTDRVSHKVAWIDSPPLANIFEWLEDHIKTGEVNWESEDWQTNNGNEFR